MKRVLFTMAVLMLLCGCGRQADQVAVPTYRVIPARLKIRIVCSQEVFKLGEPVTIMIMMQKLVGDEIHAPDAYGSAIVKVDGKEFRRPGWGGTWVAPWDGPGYVPKDFEIGIGLTLSQYGISKEILSVGTHVVVVTIGQDVSNTLTITVIENR